MSFSCATLEELKRSLRTKTDLYREQVRVVKREGTQTEVDHLNHLELELEDLKAEIEELLQENGRSLYEKSVETREEIEALRNFAYSNGRQRTGFEAANDLGNQVGEFFEYICATSIRDAKTFQQVLDTCNHDRTIAHFMCFTPVCTRFGFYDKRYRKMGSTLHNGYDALDGLLSLFGIHFKEQFIMDLQEHI